MKKILTREKESGNKRGERKFLYFLNNPIILHSLPTKVRVRFFIAIRFYISFRPMCDYFSRNDSDGGTVLVRSFD